eukprot:UN25124
MEVGHPNGELIRHVGNNLITTEVTGVLLGRETEYETISTFLETHLKQRQGGCLFIAGSPGTGKSASLYNIENRDLVKWKKSGVGPFQVVHFKATCCGSVQNIYTLLYQEIVTLLDLPAEEGQKTGMDAKDALTDLILGRNKSPQKKTKRASKGKRTNASCGSG